MRFALIDASPRGKGSNSATILSWIASGMAASGASLRSIVHLADYVGCPTYGGAIEEIDSAETILIAFPLYTDFVPGLLKGLLDIIAARGRAALAGKRVAWIVHSGFPESAQIEPTARWLKRAVSRLGAVDAGVAIRGGSEGYRLMPPSMTARLRRLFASAGSSLALTGAFDERVLDRLARPRRLGWPARIALKLLAPIGVLNGYWNHMLRRHGAMDRRFDAPYGEAYRGW